MSERIAEGLGRNAVSADAVSDRPPTVRVDVDGTVAIVTVGSGRRRNAMPAHGWVTLAETMDRISERDDIAAVLIRGNGATFCAGADLREWIGASETTIELGFARMERAFRAIELCPVPVVAQIAGVAAGAGCQLAMACDLRIVTDSARIGMPIARLGINASPAFAARLTRVAGPSVAAQLLYTGRLLTGPEAVRAGIADQHVSDTDIDSHILSILADITRHPSTAIRSAKAAIRVATGHPPEINPRAAVDYPALQNGIAQIFDRTSA